MAELKNPEVKQNSSYSSSRDTVKSPSSSSPDRGSSSSSSRGSFRTPPQRPTAEKPTPAELRQGINSPNISPLQKRQMLDRSKKDSSRKTKGSKFPRNTVFLMMSLAIFLDLLQWGILAVAGEYIVGEVINDAIDPVIQGMFDIWYWIRGVNLMSAKNLMTQAGSFVGKEISQGVLPLWSLEVGLFIAIAKAEEKAEELAPGITKVI